jgi:hypothetical protein
VLVPIDGFIIYAVEIYSSGTTYIKFHHDQFRNFSNIKGSTSTVSEDTVLVLLTRGIYNVRHLDGLEWPDVHINVR